MRLAEMMILMELGPTGHVLWASLPTQKPLPELKLSCRHLPSCVTKFITRFNGRRR